MAGTRQLALLRGINVGGKNKVAMADLRATFEELGFDDVSTYINSGNVLFSAPRQKGAELAARLETELSARFGFALRVVVIGRRALAKVIAEAPEGFGAETDRCDVVFLRPPLTAVRAFAAFEGREGVDRYWRGPGVVYCSRLAERATASRMNRIVGTPEYQNMTIRSWGTTKKLTERIGPDRSE